MTVEIGFFLQGRGALADREAITTLALRADGLGIFVLDFSVGAVPEMLDVLERTTADVKPRVRG